MSQEEQPLTTSEVHRSATHHPLRAEGPRHLPLTKGRPEDFPPIEHELEDVWTPKIEALEAYIENYVQPLAESVEKIVSRMEVIESQLDFLSNRVNELRNQSLQDGMDISECMKRITDITPAATEWTPPGLTPIEISQALSNPLDGQ